MRHNTQCAAQNTFNTLPETIRMTLNRLGLLSGEAKVVIGVSGGADSVALLRAFHELGICCTVAHVNHRLRGEDSDADEQFVRDLAGNLGFPVSVKSVDVKGLAERTGQSVEMAARQARHEFFAGFGPSTIALAHHADDQVETFFLKLARGAGAEGLGGMAYAQRIGPLRLIRPMLGIPRAEIIDWLKGHGFDWREDASNSDETYLRNRVRHTVLPMLEKELNPEIRDAVLRTMEILRDENAWMAEQLEGLTLETCGNKALRRRVLRNWLFENGAEEAGFDAVEQILRQMADGQGTTVFELNNRQRVVVEYGIPRFEHVVQAGIPAAGSPECRPDVLLTVEPGTGWRKDHGKGVGLLPAEASFDAAKVGDSPIEVRGWQPGDRMEPLGMEGSRKLQDILTDQKVPRLQRPRIPVVVCRREIIWLPGYRTARDWEVHGRNGNAVHVRIEQNGAG
jgi:tRNA(Ile)-lysidine synthase